MLLWFGWLSKIIQIRARIFEPLKNLSLESDCSHTFTSSLALAIQTRRAMKSTHPDRRAVLIFDWDDTICPSSFVDKSQIENFKDLPLHVSDCGVVFWVV